MVKEEGGGEKRGRRKRKLLDPNAPKRPDSGYIRFFKAVKLELVGSEGWEGPGSVAKIAGRWNGLSAEEKAVYLKAAEADRLLWNKNMEEYRKSDQYKAFKRQCDEEARKESRKKGEEEEQADFAALKAGDIPIFSKEFLDHNREREWELRRVCSEVRTLEEESEAIAARTAQLALAAQHSRAQAAELKETAAKLESTLSQTQKQLLAALTAIPHPDKGKLGSNGSLGGCLEALAKAYESRPQELQKQVQKALASVKLCNLNSS